ncbi:hypothetical protein FRC06_009056, partial [Ceratobasidium sp. 370]
MPPPTESQILLALALGVYMLKGGKQIKIVNKHGISTKYHIIEQVGTQKMKHIQTAMDLRDDKELYWSIWLKIHFDTRSALGDRVHTAKWAHVRSDIKAQVRNMDNWVAHEIMKDILQNFRESNKKRKNVIRHHEDDEAGKDIKDNPDDEARNDGANKANKAEEQSGGEEDDKDEEQAMAKEDNGRGLTNLKQTVTTTPTTINQLKTSPIPKKNSKKPAPKRKHDETDDNEEEPPKLTKMNKGKARVVMLQRLQQDKVTKKAADMAAKKRAATTTPTTTHPVPNVPTTTSSRKVTNPKGKAAPKFQLPPPSQPPSKPTTSSKLATASKITTSKTATKSNKTASAANSTETATAQKSTTAERQVAHEAKKAAGVSSKHAVNNPVSAPDQAASMSSTTISHHPNLKGLKLTTRAEKAELVTEFNL